MRRSERDTAFVQLVDARRGQLVRTAYLLCGDWHRAEDLAQQALARLYVAWPRVAGNGGEDAYLRRVLVNTFRDDWRWRHRRPEHLVDRLPDEPADPAGEPAFDRDELRVALAALPLGQRKVVVLRYWLDLPVAEVARDLGVSTGTVKSQSARALSRLRQVLAETDDLTTRRAR